VEEAGRDRADKPLADEEDGRQDMELGVGVDASVGENDEDGPEEADKGTGVEVVEEGMQEFEER